VKLTQRLSHRLGQAAEQARERARDRLHRSDEPATAPAPDAPGSRPRAAFAGVLDGRHLWLAVDATPGSLAVRDTATGAILPLASDLAEDDPRYRSVRSDLTALAGDPADEPCRFEVVITAPGGKVHRVWTPPPARNEPVRTPPAGETQWQVARSADGTLELVREPAAAGAALVGIDAPDDETVTLRIAGAPDGADLRLIDDESGEVLLSRPLEPGEPGEPGVAVASIAHTEVPEGVGLSAAVHVGDLPVRRRASDLARPDNAVMLPQVQNESTEGPLFSLVYRWLPDGVLRVRRPKGVPA
jgi:hypothetical protein